MYGSGVKDLVLHDSTNGLRVYKNTATSGSVPVFQTPPQYINTWDGKPLHLERGPRFDIGDWNGDGKPDVITGTNCNGPSELYLHYQTVGMNIRMGNKTTVSSDTCYNFYPRLFDINYDGKVDLVRGINWGDIKYWLNPFQLGLSNPTQFHITDAAGLDVPMKARTDGAIVDFGDLNGDCSLDMVFGGHENNALIYVAYSSTPRC